MVYILYLCAFVFRTPSTSLPSKPILPSCSSGLKTACNREMHFFCSTEYRSGIWIISQTISERDGLFGAEFVLHIVGVSLALCLATVCLNAGSFRSEKSKGASLMKTQRSSKEGHYSRLWSVTPWRGSVYLTFHTYSPCTFLTACSPYPALGGTFVILPVWLADALKWSLFRNKRW